MAPTGHATPNHPGLGRLRLRRTARELDLRLPQHDSQDRVPRGAKGFVILPRRWKVERTLGWIMKSRRNVRDDERQPQHSEAHLTWALITLMTRRLTRSGPRADWTRGA
ncbi:transposase [Streptomyces sp. SID8356]|nr:transposase [Streptomyces sp. SID8356]